MSEWGCDEEERKMYRIMLETQNPAPDCGVVEDAGEVYYIVYAL